VKSAAVKVGDLSESYKNAAEALTGLSVSNADGATYAENLKKVNDNLEALNNVYEMQIREGSNSTQLSSQMYTNIQQMIENLNASVEDTKRYKENIAELSNNLQSLNTIYGNM